MPYRNPAKVPYSMTGPAIVKIFAPTPSTKPSACVKIGHIIFLLFSNFTIQSNCNQLFLLKGASSGQPCNCFYDFLGEIIMTPEINLYSSIFIPPVRFLHRPQDDACPWDQGGIHTVHGFRQIYLALELYAWMSRSFLKYPWHTSHLPGFLSESIYLLVEILCQIGL